MAFLQPWPVDSGSGPAVMAAIGKPVLRLSLEEKILVPVRASCRGETKGEQGRGWRRARGRLKESRGEAGGEQGRGWRRAERAGERLVEPWLSLGLFDFPHPG